MQRTLLVAALLLSLGTGNAWADCKFMEFAIKDYEHMSTNVRVALAFLSLVTKEQYEQIKDKLSVGVYGKAFEGTLDYSDFRTRLSKELALSTYTYDEASSSDYVSQHLSPAAANAYAQCLDHDVTVLGLRMWLSE